MKAKMPQSQKPAEPADYQCLVCDATFSFDNDQQTEMLVCPNCGNADRKDLVPIYMENNPVEQTMYTASDWHGG